MKLRSLATWVAFSSLFATSVCYGWDSETRNGVRDMPIVRQKSFEYSPRPWVNLPDMPEYDTTEVFTTNLKDRVGGQSVDPADATSLNNFYVCPPSFATDGSNLAGCRTATRAEITVGWAWLRARLANDNPPDSEHFLIAKAAANLAGLSTLTLFDPFWVRYPVQNAYLASPSGKQLLVSQSWQPASDLPSSTQALRSVSLLELAQLPDISNSLADWVEGNELCPVSGFEGAFSGSTVQNCHDFGSLLGAINSTHFAPLNRQSWQYYHSLAMQRMAQCPKLDALVQPFYSHFAPIVCAPGTPITECDPTNHPWYQALHGNATEEHECEREAMAYEMVAQHFMQDSWSTGHMWKRWGKANFSQFDFELPEYSGSAEIPAENRAPRRGAIALLTAALAGEIHGAKQKLIEAARTYVPAPVVVGASWLGLADDPLCGPNYHRFIPPDTVLTRDVEWRSNGGSPFSGAGDLFWDPLASSEFFPARVSQDDKYVEQRTRMLECSAASMLEAYNASGKPHAHGEPTPNPTLDGIQPGGDGCWDHWATNQSMRAALGVLSYAYDNTTQLKAANLANELVLKDRASGLSFVKDSDTSVPHYTERRADRDHFIAQLGERMNQDLADVQIAYIQNVAEDPDGLKSAHGIGPDGLPITMLGVGPIDTPPASSGDATPDPPTDYADRLVKQDASDYAPSDAGSPSNAMAQLFWRGNVERICRTSLLNNAQQLLSLREKCIAKAAGGGDPDACTACVQIAELHVPNVSYGPNVDIPVGDSKCSALGASPKGQASGGLPGWWFDNYYRLNGIHQGEPVVNGLAGGLGYPAFDVALTWCTGAELRESQGGALPGQDDLTFTASDDGWLPARDSEISYEPTTEMFCTDDFGNPFATKYGISHRRYAQAFIEDYNRASQNWVFPIVTAVDYTSEWIPFGQCGAQRIDSRTKRFESAAGVQNGLVYVPQSKVSHAHGGAAGVSAPRCGVRQAMYYWNRPCQTALEHWKFLQPPTFNTFFPEQGTEADQIEYGQDGDPANDFCLLREPRTFAETCPDNMKCSSDGECSSDDQAAVVNLFPPPSPGP